MNESFKIVKSKRNFPTFQKRPCFPSELLFTTMWHEQEHKQKALERYTFMCFCACSTGQQRPQNTVKYVCAKEMDGWGCSQGYFRDLALASWRIPPLSHTSLISFIASFPEPAALRFCAAERKHTLSPLCRWNDGACTWAVGTLSGSGRVRAWTAAARGAGLVKREDCRSQQASISPLMSSMFAAKGYLSSSPQIIDNHGDRARRGWPTFFIPQ